MQITVSFVTLLGCADGVKTASRTTTRKRAVTVFYVTCIDMGQLTTQNCKCHDGCPDYPVAAQVQLTYHVYSTCICIFCLITNLPGIVSCISILNNLLCVFY